MKVQSALPPCGGGLAEALAKLEQAQDSLLAESLWGLGTKEAEAQGSAGTTDQGTSHAGTTPFGIKATQGQRPNMEDAYCVQMQQFGPVAGPAAPSDPAAGSSPHAADSPEAAVLPSSSPDSDGNEILAEATIPEDLAVLSVFDGHGGTEVATHCRDRLHKHFATSLNIQQRCGSSMTADGGLQGSEGSGGDDDTASPSSPVDNSLTVPSFSDSATLPGSKLCTGSYTPSVIKEALRAAFHRTDQELAGTETGEFVGATAVVAVIGRQHIWIAHCGDSRAVIQRAGDAEALTRDHKPDRDDEAARIKAAGGRIVFTSGSHRVMGMLAMSRAIGDHFLRPYVIADPEVSCVERTPQDEVLVLATDGLWDVFSCKEATTLAQRCISRSKERGMSRHGACRVAASVLTKVALERGSRDNITVIVVDVSYPQPQPQQPLVANHQPSHQLSRLRPQVSDSELHSQTSREAPAISGSSTGTKQANKPAGTEQQAEVDTTSRKSPHLPAVSAAQQAAAPQTGHSAQPSQQQPVAGNKNSSSNSANNTGGAAAAAQQHVVSQRQPRKSATEAGALGADSEPSHGPTSKLADKGVSSADKSGQQVLLASAPAAVKPSASSPAITAKQVAQASLSSGGRDAGRASQSNLGNRNTSYSVSSCTWLKGYAHNTAPAVPATPPVTSTDQQDPKAIGRVYSAPEGPGQPSAAAQQQAPAAHPHVPARTHSSQAQCCNMSTPGSSQNTSQSDGGMRQSDGHAAGPTSAAGQAKGLHMPQHSSVPNLVALCSMPEGECTSPRLQTDVVPAISEQLAGAARQPPQPASQQTRAEKDASSAPPPLTIPPTPPAPSGSNTRSSAHSTRHINGGPHDGPPIVGKPPPSPLQPLSPPSRHASENGTAPRGRVTVKRPPSSSKLDMGQAADGMSGGGAAPTPSPLHKADSGATLQPRPSADQAVANDAATAGATQTSQ